MKSLRKMMVIALAAALAISATACSSNKSAPMEMPLQEDYIMASSEAAAAPEMKSMTGEGGNNITNRSDMNTTIADTSRKLIRRVYLNAETKSFDDLSTQITKQVGELGGYFESSEVGGRGGKGRPEAAGMGEPRYAHMVIRVPKNNVDAFVGMVSENSNVVAKTESTEDVTLEYVDVESRKKALTVEQDSLLTLLGKAEKIEDIIKLEERLSQVRYQIESYGSQLRLYDNQVDYSTVTLDVSEVQRETPIETTTMLSRIKIGLEQTIYDLGKGTGNFTVWFVVNIPYLLIFTAVLLVAWLVVRRFLKKRKKTLKMRTLEQVTQPPIPSPQEMQYMETNDKRTKTNEPRK